MKKILIVEDEAEIAESLKDLIELEMDLEIDLAVNAESGLEIFKSKDYALVITDINMPGKSGIWLMQEIRNLKNNFPVVFMTGFSSATPDELKEMGAEHLIRKPNDIPNIVQILTDIISDLEK